MLRPRSPQASFYGSYLYDKIVPTDHLLRKINRVVDFSFVHELVKDRYTPDFGRPAEDPEFMLRLCLLQYLYGDSDRQVIENARVNLAYKYFLGLAVDEEPPDFTTVSYFRAVRLGEERFRQVFESIVRQCIDKGLVTGKRQIIDSTHIVADMAVTSLTGLIKLCRRNILKSVENQDPELAEKLGINNLQVVKQDKFTRLEEGLQKEIEEAKTLLDEVTTELKDMKLRVTPELQNNLELLEKAVADRTEGSKDRLVSPVDPDARRGKKENKRWAGYKGHLVIEEDSEIITAIETTPGNVDDGTRLKPLLKQQEEALSLVPDELSGDKAYDAGANLEQLETRRITGYISLSKKANHSGPGFYTVDDFKYDEASNTLTCPGGCTAVYRRQATFRTERHRRNGVVFQFHSTQCNACVLKSRCHPANRGRAVAISYYKPYHQQMKERMATDEGRAAYLNRYKIEHKVADLARYCGMRRSRYRRLTGAGIHTLLAAIVSNVKRMARLLWEIPEIPPPKVALAT
jgi:transposase/gas vesicle protein